MTKGTVLVHEHDAIEVDPDAPVAEDKLGRRQSVELLTG